MPSPPKDYFPDWTLEYAAGETAVFGDYTNNPPPQANAQRAALPTWILPLGGGTITMTNEDGSTGYYVCGSSPYAPIFGTWTALIETTCQRIRIGTSWPGGSSP